MKRREFITLLACGVAGSRSVARAQQPERTWRVGVLLPFTADDPEAHARKAALEKALDESGWTIGRNLQIDYRFAGGADDPHSPLRGRIGCARA